MDQSAYLRKHYISLKFDDGAKTSSVEKNTLLNKVRVTCRHTDYVPCHTATQSRQDNSRLLAIFPNFSLDHFQSNSSTSHS